MVCPICKEQLKGPHPKGIKDGNIYHFNCVYKSMHGKDWVEPKWLKEMNSKYPSGEVETRLSAK